MKQVSITVLFLFLLGVGTLHAESKEAMELNRDGVALLQEGKKEEALEAFKKAVELDSTNAVALLNLAYTYDQQGMTEEAVAAYQDALQIDPRNLLAYNNLGVLYDTLGKYDEAMAAFQSALEIDPQDANTLQNLENAKKSKAVIDEREAQFAELHSAVAAQPDNPMVLYKLGRLYAFYDKNDQALDWINRALEKGYDDLDYIKIDPALTGLRQDERFQKLMER